jgi:hypothetical protein
MGRQRAVQATREMIARGKSSTLDLISCDVTGDAHELAWLAAELALRLSAATGRDPALILDDLEKPATPRRTLR